MKRIVLWIGVGVTAAAIAVLVTLLLTTCLFDNHEYAAATCTEPETCTRCGEPRGEPLGHDFLPATCTEPEICARCGEHRGDPLGHDFLPATCTEPEICARCGARQGEPLGHIFTEATHQNAATCLRCGCVEGEPVAADCAALPLTYMEVGTPYPYTTASYEDFDVDVTGTVEIVDHRVIPGDETFPAREGYEWHVVTVRLVFSGDDVRQNGMQSAMTYGDYYTTDAEIGTGTDENGLRPFVAEFYGMRVQCWQKTCPDEEGGWFGSELRYTWKEGVLVPCGYDGTMLIFYHFRHARNADRLFIPAQRVLDENALVFRFR